MLQKRWGDYWRTKSQQIEMTNEKLRKFIQKKELSLHLVQIFCLMQHPTSPAISTAVCNLTKRLCDLKWWPFWETRSFGLIGKTAKNHSWSTEWWSACHSCDYVHVVTVQLKKKYNYKKQSVEWKMQVRGHLWSEINWCWLASEPSLLHKIPASVFLHVSQRVQLSLIVF